VSPVIWECRFFFSPDLAGYAVDELAERLGLPAPPPSRATILDRDFYLVAARTSNVKVRDRLATLKVKTLLVAEPDGFELWRTDAETALPAPLAAWARAFRLAGGDAVAARTGDLEALAAETTAAAAAVSIERRAPGSIIEVVKRRNTLDVDGARLETAEVLIGDRGSRSLSFESADLAAARLLKARIDTSGLGEPANYVDILARDRR